MVLAGTSPRDGTGWYKHCRMYRALGLSACSPIRRQAQARAPVRMHLVGAYVMPYHTVNLQNKQNLLGIHMQISQLTTLKLPFIVQDPAQSSGTN